MVFVAEFCWIYCIRSWCFVPYWLKRESRNPFFFHLCMSRRIIWTTIVQFSWPLQHLDSSPTASWYIVVRILAIIHWLSQFWGSLKIHRLQKWVNRRTSHRHIKVLDALYILAQCTETCITTNVTATRDTSVLTDSSRDCTKA